MEAKKIIITGGATRIGAAIAKSLVNYDTKMVIHFNKSKSSALKLKKELEELGAETFLLKADLNNFKQTNSLIKNAYTKMRGLDCLINNASVFENDNLENFSEKSFSKIEALLIRQSKPFIFLCAVLTKLLVCLKLFKSAFNR